MTDDIWKYVIQCIALYKKYMQRLVKYKLLAHDECTFWASS